MIVPPEKIACISDGSPELSFYHLLTTALYELRAGRSNVFLRRLFELKCCIQVWVKLKQFAGVASRTGRGIRQCLISVS